MGTFPKHTMRYVSAVLAALTCAASLAAGQSLAFGRMEGTITTKAHNKLLLTTSIEATRLDYEPATTFHTTPDDHGRFHLDSLPVGRYMLQLASATLDSLELAIGANETRVVAGETAYSDFSLPAGTALRDAVCRGVTLGKGRVAVVGRAINADTEEPLANAKVVVSWNDIRVDRNTLKLDRQQHSGEITTGRRGDFRLCGVPAGSMLAIQLQHESRAGGIAHVIVSEEEGALVRNLSLSVSTAPTMSTLDSLELAMEFIAAGGSQDSNSVLRLSGTSAVTGTVLSSTGQPVAGVEVRVTNSAAVTITDASGKFTLTDLPAGTQLLNVRRLGYSVVETGVELRSGKNVTRNVKLDRVASLDSIRVVAERSRLADFEYNRRTNLFGRFFTRDEVAHKQLTELTELFGQIGGFAIIGHGPDAKVVSTSTSLGRPSCAEANVVIDGVPRADVNYVLPNEVAGIEVYRDGTSAPARYQSNCGVIIIWTKRYRAPPKRTDVVEPSTP